MSTIAESEATGRYIDGLLDALHGEPAVIGKMDGWLRIAVHRGQHRISRAVDLACLPAMHDPYGAGERDGWEMRTHLTEAQAAEADEQGSTP